MSKEARITIKSHDGAGVQYVNDITVKSDPTDISFTDATGQQIVDAVWSWIGTEYRAVVPASVAVDVAELRGILGYDGRNDHVVGAAGTRADGFDNSPKELTAVMTFRTDSATRQGRGRIFLPPPWNAGAINGDKLTWSTSHAYWTAAQALLAKLLAGQTFTHGGFTSHLSLRVFSKKHGISRDVTSGLVQPKIHWLRSRSTAP